jgi:hypothetical protein
MAPSGGEDLRASTLLDREEGDYLCEDHVREAADAVEISSLFTCSVSIVLIRSRIVLSGGCHRSWTALERGGFALPRARIAGLHLLWLERDQVWWS